jgi:hypothetical protein
VKRLQWDSQTNSPLKLDRNPPKGYWETSDRKPKSVTYVYWSRTTMNTRRARESHTNIELRDCIFHASWTERRRQLLILSRSTLQTSSKSVFSPLRVNFMSQHIHQVLKCRVKPTFMSG